MIAKLASTHIQIQIYQLSKELFSIWIMWKSINIYRNDSPRNWHTPKSENGRNRILREQQWWWLMILIEMNQISIFAIATVKHVIDRQVRTHITRTRHQNVFGGERRSGRSWQSSQIQFNTNCCSFIRFVVCVCVWIDVTCPEKQNWGKIFFASSIKGAAVVCLTIIELLRFCDKGQLGNRQQSSWRFSFSFWLLWLR